MEVGIASYMLDAAIVYIRNSFNREAASAGAVLQLCPAHNIANT